MVACRSSAECGGGTSTNRPSEAGRERTRTDFVVAACRRVSKWEHPSVRRARSSCAGTGHPVKSFEVLKVRELRDHKREAVRKRRSTHCGGRRVAPECVECHSRCRRRGPHSVFVAGAVVSNHVPVDRVANHEVGERVGVLRRVWAVCRVNCGHVQPVPWTVVQAVVQYNRVHARLREHFIGCPEPNLLRSLVACADGLFSRIEVPLDDGRNELTWGRFNFHVVNEPASRLGRSARNAVLERKSN